MFIVTETLMLEEPTSYWVWENGPASAHFVRRMYNYKYIQTAAQNKTALPIIHVHDPHKGCKAGWL